MARIKSVKLAKLTNGRLAAFNEDRDRLGVFEVRDEAERVLISRGRESLTVPGDSQ